MKTSEELHLSSLFCCDVLSYIWGENTIKEYDAAQEIVSTINLVRYAFPELRVVVRTFVLKDYDTKSYQSMKLVCDKFNKAVDKLKGSIFYYWPQFTEDHDIRLRQHIHQQIYNRAIRDPRELNEYSSFSPEVYGETSYHLVAEMIHKLNPTDDDVFIDLGSGVGQVVLQISANTYCKECIGIELMDAPAAYAVSMQDEFVKVMNWYGKRFRPFKLIKGDFLDLEYRDLILKSTIIFVNNYAFGPELDHQLKRIFEELPDGTRIVSSRQFSPVDFRITHRNLTDIGCIMNVQELARLPRSVSWTPNPVPYFLHTVDRTRLEKYFYSSKANEKKDDGMRRRKRKHNWIGEIGEAGSCTSSSLSSCSSVASISPSRSDDHSNPST